MEEEVIGKAYDHHLMRRMLAYLRPYRRAVALSVVLLLVNSILQTVGPLITKLAVDRYLVPSPSVPVSSPLNGWLAADPWTGIAQLSLLFLAVVIASLLFEFLQIYFMQWTGQKAMFDLRRDLMAHLQRLDIAYFDRHPVGRLVTRVTTDVDVLNELFASGLVTIVGDVLVLSFILIAMFELSPGLTLLMLAVMPLVILATIRFRRTVQHSYRRIRIAIAKINAFLQEHVNGIAVLQLFNRESKAAGQFDSANRDHMEAFKDSIFAYGWFYPVVEFLSMLALALLLAYGGFRIRSGALTAGVLVAFFQYGMRFFRPIQDLSEKYNILQSAMASAERIFKLLDTPVAIQAPQRASLSAFSNDGIAFEGVWFAYKGEEWVLQDVSFRISPGETIAVVGHTGAGKTTLTNLLLRFYDIQRGSIRVGGIDIRELDPLELRRRFAIVLQDPFLFTGSLDENIRLGTQDIPDTRISTAIEQVNLREFIASVPGGLQYQVRERGQGLSTGQKQLLSFARALAHDPRYLILDEATSSVDTETEFRIREALARLVTGRTSIVIAHRLSTIQRADRIFVMHKGRLRETGTHQELLALRGIYYKLYQLQYKDQELATLSEPV
jgi:ATP-binding cassette subfamily B protein